MLPDRRHRCRGAEHPDRNARLVSLGQAAFLGIGAFAAGLLQRAYDVPFPVALAAAMVAGGIVGALVALLSLRLRALYVAVTTLVLHFTVTTIFSFVQAVFLDSSGIILPLPSLGFMELQTPMQWYYFLLTIAALIVVGALNVLRSYIGRRWIAVGEHDVAAEALGVPVRWAKLSVFTATSAVTGFAGALGAYYVGTLSFESYNFGLAISYLAMIIVGGMGSVLGSVLGAVFITLLPFVLDQFFLLLDLRIRPNILAGIHQIAFGCLIVRSCCLSRAALPKSGADSGRPPPTGRSAIAARAGASDDCRCSRSKVLRWSTGM